MSTATTTPQRDAAQQEDTRHTRRFGLPVATALVMGNIIGGGIFLLPASVAPYGTISLVAFGVLTLGAIALALVFGRLAHRLPRTGGPYVYARAAFGDFAGFLAAWSYWITAWVSNAALAVAAVGYLDVLVPVHASKPAAIAAALAFQWLPALANLAGTRYVGAVQIVATVLKFVPLILVAVGGLFFFDSANLGPFHPSGGARSAPSPPPPRSCSSATSASSPPPSAPARSATPAATSGAPPSSAPSAPPPSTCSAPSPSSAPSPTTSWSPPPHPSPTPRTPCSAAPGAAPSWPAWPWSASSAPSTAGPC